MKAIVFEQPGGPGVLRLSEVPNPIPTPEQLLVRVRATGLNRADILQRLGKYPSPQGESEILGLEIAGEVLKVGAAAQGFALGDRVFALVGGGGYAEQATVDYRMALKIPNGWSFYEAAAIPEAFFIAQETIFTLGHLEAGESILIHAAGSGVGTASVQMARSVGARVFVTAGTASKIRKARELGAEGGCNYKEHDFVTWVQEMTHGQGVNLIQDPIGSAYWDRNIQCLRKGGRLVLLGLMGGVTTEINLNTVLTKRLTIMGTVLRSRSLEEKISIVQQFRECWLPLLVSGSICPTIDTVYPLTQVADAHRHMEANKNIGKVVLEV